MAGSRSSPATEIYDQYVERSRSLRRQSVAGESKKKDGNFEMVKNEKSRMRRHCSLNNIRSLEVKEKEMADRSLRRHRSVVEHNKAGRLEMHENAKTTVATRDGELYNSRPLEEKRRETVAGQSLPRPMSLGRLDMQHENEKTTGATRSLEGKKKATVGQGLTRPMSLGTLQKPYENDKTTMATRGPLEGKKKATIGQGLTRPMSLGTLQMQHENEKRTMANRGDDICNIRSLEGKKKAVGQGLTRPMSIGTLQMQYENEKITTATRGDDLYNTKFLEEKRKETVSQSLTRPQSLGRLDMHENEKSSHDDDDDVNKMFPDEKREEMDDLKRRAEEFIARITRQRMLEDTELDSST